MLFGDAALVGAKKDAVVALERDHGKAVFALKMAAVADVDAQLVQDLLVVGGDLIAAKLTQISGRHTVCCGIGAGVDAANGVPSAYLGKFGSDEVAAYNQKILHELGIDISHCRHFEGENGFAMVTLKGNDRVFLGSNKGGVAKEHSFDFTQEDLEYIKGFNLIYTNLNSYIEEDLPFLHTAGVPIAYDFSTRWTDAYLEKVCPYVTVAILSCAHLSAEDRAREMQKAADHGVSIVLGTIGEDGSYVLYNGKTYYASAVHADDVIDTMGAGDSYFAAFLCSLLKSSKSGALLEGTEEENAAHLQEAMQIGAAFAAKMCAKEGAFGYGTPIVGRTEL